MTVPIWLVLVVLGLLVVLPIASRYLRSHDHAALADELDEARSLVALFVKSISTSDHTGAVAATVEKLAPEHGVEDHPEVKKVTQ